MNDNILTQIEWMVTTEGLKTPEYVLKNLKTVQLEENQLAYVYGAQFRFLMTLLPLIISRLPNRDAEITDEIIVQVLETLEPASHVFDPENPFLQLHAKDVKDKRIKDPEGSLWSPPWKLLAAQAGENHTLFWNFGDNSNKKDTYSLQEAVLLMVSAYFYLPGGNSMLDGRRVKNFSSALRYAPTDRPSAVEIIPVAENLQETLMLNIPKSFLKPSDKGTLLPHWADREGNTFNQDGTPTDLWTFSWQPNSWVTRWEEDRTILTGVSVCGHPAKYLPGLTSTADDLEAPNKDFHDDRATRDPLYFYIQPAKETEGLKMKFFNIGNGSAIFKTIAQWNADSLSSELNMKWGSHVKKVRLPEDLIFLEHSVGGTAQSFTIRYSTLTRGYLDEFMHEDIVNETIADLSEKVITAQRRLTGFFSEQGKMKNIANRRDHVEMLFWNENQNLVREIATIQTPQQRKDFLESVDKRIRRNTEKVFLQVSLADDTTNLKNHYECLNIIKGMKL